MMAMSEVRWGRGVGGGNGGGGNDSGGGGGVDSGGGGGNGCGVGVGGGCGSNISTWEISLSLFSFFLSPLGQNFSLNLNFKPLQ